MGSLQDLVASIIEDGVVDADEAAAFEAVVFADGVIERDEADAAFAINDAVSGRDNDPEWERVFVRTVAAYVLEDDETPGAVDSDEAAYLIEKIGADGNYDDVERALISHISAHATSIHSSLNVLIDSL